MLILNLMQYVDLRFLKMKFEKKKLENTLSLVTLHH